MISLTDADQIQFPKYGQLSSLHIRLLWLSHKIFFLSLRFIRSDTIEIERKSELHQLRNLRTGIEVKIYTYIYHPTSRQIIKPVHSLKTAQAIFIYWQLWETDNITNSFLPIETTSLYIILLKCIFILLCISHFGNRYSTIIWFYS